MLDFGLFYSCQSYRFGEFVRSFTPSLVRSFFSMASNHTCLSRFAENIPPDMNRQMRVAHRGD